MVCCILQETAANFYFLEFGFRDLILLYRLAPYFGVHQQSRHQLSLFPSKTLGIAFLFTFFHHGGCGLGRIEFISKVIGISSLSSLGYVKVYTHITGDVEIVQITKDELLLRLTTRQVTKFETSQSGARPVEFSRSTERMSDLKKKTEKYAQEKWILKVNRRPKEEELRYGDGTMKADVSLRAHTLLVYVAPYQITFDGIRKQDHVIRKQDHVIYLWIFNHNRSTSDLLLDSCKR